VDGRGGTGGGVGSGVEEDLGDPGVPLEGGTGEGGLAAVVDPVGLGAAGQQCAHRVGVAVVGGEHDEGVAAVVGEVGGDPGVHIGGQLLGPPLPGQIEDLGRQLHDLG